MSESSELLIEECLIEDAVKWFQELLRINTCNPPGNEHLLIEYLAGVFKQWDIPYEIFELEKGRSNILAGAVTDPHLILTSHADTVPILNREAWTQDPHGGALVDGCIWGRGAVDMKFKIAFDLALMQWAKKNDVHGAVSMVVVAGEETGGQFGSQFLCSRHKNSLKGKYVINEIGGFPLHIGGKQLLLMQSGEKGHAIFNLSFSGPSIHASTPVDSMRMRTIANGIERFCNRVESYQLCKSSTAFASTLEAALPEPYAPLATALKSAEHIDEAIVKFSEIDPAVAAQVRAMFFNTCTPTVTSIGEVANVLSASGSVVFDVRILPGTDVSDYAAVLKKEVEVFGKELGLSVEAQCLRATPGYEIDVEDQLFTHCVATLEQNWGERCGGAKVAPFLLPASSDSSHFAREGFTPIGFSPLLFPEGFPGFALAHAVDERVPLKSFTEGVRLYIQALGSFLKG